ncbi:MAG: O-antigen ligase family protein [Clostridia bacterium]|nr:O-antigen ligase family protein [Clostridia bacterium]
MVLNRKNTVKKEKKPLFKKGEMPAVRINFYIAALMLLMLGIVFTILTARSSLSSLLFTGTFIVLFVMLVDFCVCRGGINPVLLLFIALCAFNVIVTTWNFSFGYFKKLIMFVCTIAFFYIISLAKINKTTVKIVMIVNLILSAVYFIAYRFMGARVYRGESLILNFANPNFAGLYVLQSCLYCILGFFYFKNIIVKALCVGLEVFLLSLLFATRTRSCQIALVCFVAFVCFNLFFFNKIKITKVMSWILLVSPIIIAAVYLYMSKTGAIEIFSFMEDAGKPLDSREIVWKRGLEVFRDNVFLGKYYEISNGTGQSQMLNTHLDVLISYGIIPFALFIYLLCAFVERIRKEATTVFQKNALLAFYATIIMGAFEAALVSGGLGLYILVGGFLILAKYNPNEEKAENEDEKVNLAEEAEA